MQPDACEPEEHSCRDLRLRCEPQRLLAWWAKLVHRVLVQEAMKATWENQGERQDTSAASEAAGLCLRPVSRQRRRSLRTPSRRRGNTLWLNALTRWAGRKRLSM